MCPPRAALVLVIALLVPLAACSADAPSTPATQRLAVGGEVAIAIDLPAAAGPALSAAAEDLSAAFAAITEADPLSDRDDARAHITFAITPDDATLGPQGYRLEAQGDTLTVTAATELGAAYALWGLAWDLGVRWLHPEETFTPTAPRATLAWGGPARTSRPAFELRGFHEHTQHPIPLSDTLLRTNVAGGRSSVSRHLRWLARNRQSFMSFHLLNTNKDPTWFDYMRGIADEARGLGVALGVVVSFADQQQHAVKLIDPGERDENGDPMPEATQIASGLDHLVGLGFDHIIFQIGTSEFTSPAPAVARGWLDTAVAHLAAHHPSVTAHAWVHITCGLEDASGRPFFHVPLDANPRLGAFVHTTMFYTLTAPAPVYDCADFTHQLDFLEAADGQRRQTFFPESAWWLGFDNNLPLLLPITGASRQDDLATIAPYDVTGHVTFTTGREWTYWQYDHYIARATWDPTLTWAGYLEAMAPAYGEHGALVAEVLEAWTERQRQDLYGDHPEIIFYLAGELPQDEIGAAAGVLARRPKIPFKQIRDLDDAAFAAWQARDLTQLRDMHAAYGALVSRLPDVGVAPYGIARRLREVRRAAEVFVARIAHTLALYEGVIALRARDRAAAEAKLAEARAISAAVKAELVAAEADYRERLEWLARPKPDSLTAYPFGYLYETSTAFFWTRRDDQLAALIRATFDGEVQRWPTPPLAVFRAPAETTSLEIPADPVAAEVLGGFVPALLIAATTPFEDGLATLALAIDRDGNGQPDTEAVPFVASTSNRGFVGTVGAWPLPVFDQADQQIGTLVLHGAMLGGASWETDGVITKLWETRLRGEIDPAELIAMIRAYVGIDEEGISSLIKSIWRLDPAAPLPARLPFGLVLSPEPVSNP